MNIYQQISSRLKLRGVLVIIITIYGIFFLFLNQNNSCSNYDPKVIYIGKKEFLTDLPSIQSASTIDSKESFNLRMGRWDNQILYKMYDHVITGDEFYKLSEHYKVSLATQSSLEKLSSLEEVAKYWNGPISVAVFAAGNDELSLTLLYISILRKCNLNVRKKITFHFALPKSRFPTKIMYDEEYFLKANCEKKSEVYKNIVNRVTDATKKWRISNPYPQNHLRNLARKNCNTPYVFLTDVDVIPCNRMVEKLTDFLEHDACNKCAYVIPTYEIDNRVALPVNKSEMVRLSKKKLARPFHQKVFIYNQFATNFKEWEENTDEVSVRVSHPVTNFEMFYEPFYIAKDSVPPHDERFIGYGFTRNTQVYEMYVAGYQFHVLTPIFAVHWGLQDRKSRPHWREKQNNNNNKLFQTFKKEIFARYQNDPLHMINQN